MDHPTQPPFVKKSTFNFFPKQKKVPEAPLLNFNNCTVYFDNTNTLLEVYL